MRSAISQDLAEKKKNEKGWRGDSLGETEGSENLLRWKKEKNNPRKGEATRKPSIVAREVLIIGKGEETLNHLCGKARWRGLTSTNIGNRRMVMRKGVKDETQLQKGATLSEGKTQSRNLKQG